MSALRLTRDALPPVGVAVRCHLVGGGIRTLRLVAESGQLVSHWETPTSERRKFAMSTVVAWEPKPMAINKYGNVHSNGYASKREEARAWELKRLQEAGKISDLEEQVRYELIPKQDGEAAVHYVADFQYRDVNGELVCEDVKSPATRKIPSYIIKRKLMLHRWGIRIKEV